jgi:aminoglycoside phosphotransferase (APT) family kinase protein
LADATSDGRLQEPCDQPGTARRLESGVRYHNHSMVTDTAAVRKGEELNVDGLTAYLVGKLAGADDNIRVEQFPGGHSNLTYLLRAGRREYVLRRAPLGPVAPKAHDMAREFRVLQAISPHFPEGPRPFLLCEDPSVVGAVFFIMERRHGVILRDDVPPEIACQPSHPRRISEAVIDCLARLHAIDLESNGLLSLGKPEGFVERQVTGWTERWRRAQTDPLPEMEEVAAWLSGRVPVSGTPSLVHNDYKLDNVMLRLGTVDQVEAVLDWEMATVGDPIADLGLTLCYWVWASAPQIRTAGIPAITSRPGWFTREEMLDRYSAKTGRDVSDIGYHEVLGIFKLAVIIQQIYFRYWRGQTSDERFRNFGERVKGMARVAAQLTERYS